MAGSTFLFSRKLPSATTASDDAVIEIMLDEPSNITFVPGQYIEVQVPGSDDDWRSFSMANPPSISSRVHLMVRVIPNGRFTSKVGKEIAEGAKANCIVSRALSVPITLSVQYS